VRVSRLPCTLLLRRVCEVSAGRACVIAVPATGLQATDLSLRIEDQQLVIGIARRTMQRMRNVLPGLKVLRGWHCADQSLEVRLALPADFRCAVVYQQPAEWQLQHGHFISTILPHIESGC
jgi:hypothetical protein